jgi:hypothetical protein
MACAAMGHGTSNYSGFGQDWGHYLGEGAVIEWESSICRAAEQLAAKESFAAQTAVTAAVVADKILL